MEPDETQPQDEPEQERPPEEREDTGTATAPIPLNDLFDLAEAIRVSSRFAAG
ncbi:MAG: hypothetical protein HRU14_16800 [Planctomycetes bacterium]|nr:hypothetical protein [Planctomycetota bacterium]